MIVFDVDFWVLKYIEDKKQLQRLYFREGDEVTLIITHSNAVFRTVVKYEDTAEFKFNFLSKALEVKRMTIDTDLLTEIRNILDKQAFRESVIDEHPKVPNVMEELDTVPVKLVPDKIE